MSGLVQAVASLQAADRTLYILAAIQARTLPVTTAAALQQGVACPHVRPPACPLPIRYERALLLHTGQLLPLLTVQSMQLRGCSAA